MLAAPWTPVCLSVLSVAVLVGQRGIPAHPSPTAGTPRLYLEPPPLSLQGFRDTLHAVFCLAENSVGPSATRPDDIHLLYSGK